MRPSCADQSFITNLRLINVINVNANYVLMFTLVNMLLGIEEFHDPNNYKDDDIQISSQLGSLGRLMLRL